MLWSVGPIYTSILDSSLLTSLIPSIIPQSHEFLWFQYVVNRALKSNNLHLLLMWPLAEKNLGLQSALGRHTDDRVHLFNKYYWWIPSLSSMQAFKDCHMYDGSGNSFELSIISFKCITAYVKNKKNQNQASILFLLILQLLFFVKQSGHNRLNWHYFNIL